MENIENNNETSAPDLLNDEKRKFPFLRLIWFIAALACTLPYIWITIIHPPVNVSTISLSTYKAQLDQQPVYLTGMLESDEIIDPIFRFSVKALDLTRVVEVYEQDNSNLIIGWRKLDANHVPTTSLPFSSHKWETPKARIGIYEIDKTLLTYKNTSEQIKLTSQNLLALNSYGQKAFKVFDGYFYYSADPTTPDLGDFRVSYFANSNQVISTVGIQKNEIIIPWQLDTEPLILSRAGDVSKEELLEQTDLSNVPYSKEIEKYAPLAAATFLSLLILSALIVKIRNRRNQKKNASNFMTEDAELANVDISDEELNISDDLASNDTTIDELAKQEIDLDETDFVSEAEEVSQIANELKEQAPEITPSANIKMDDIDDTPVMTMSPEQEDNNVSPNESIPVENVISEDIAPQIQTSDAPKQTQTSTTLQEQSAIDDTISENLDNFEPEVAASNLVEPSTTSDDLATFNESEISPTSESFSAMDEEFDDFEDNFEDDFSDFSDDNDFDEGFDPPPVFQESESINVDITEEDDDDLSDSNSHESMAAQLEETKELLEEALTPTDSTNNNPNTAQPVQTNDDTPPTETEPLAETNSINDDSDDGLLESIQGEDQILEPVALESGTIENNSTTPADQEPQSINDVSEDLATTQENGTSDTEQDFNVKSQESQTASAEDEELIKTQTDDSYKDHPLLDSDTKDASLPPAETMDSSIIDEDDNEPIPDNNDPEVSSEIDSELNEDDDNNTFESDEADSTSNLKTSEDVPEVNESYDEAMDHNLENQQASPELDLNDGLPTAPIAGDYDDILETEQPKDTATETALDALSEEDLAPPIGTESQDANDNETFDDANEQFASNDEELFDLADNEDNESSSSDIDYSVLSEEELIDKLEQAMQDGSDKDENTEEEEFPTPGNDDVNDDETYSDNVNLGGPDENDLMQALTGDRGPEIPKETEENSEDDIPPAVYDENEEQLSNIEDEAPTASEIPLNNTPNDDLSQTDNGAETTESFEPIDDTSEDFLDDESFYDPFESATGDDSTIETSDEEPIDTSPKI